MKINLKKNIVLFITILQLCGGLYAQTSTSKISGTVKDESGVPLVGVNIVVKGTTTGTVTDTNGKYSLNAENKNSVFVFAYIGFISQEIAVANKSKIDVVLAEDNLKLDEVVVTALGIKKEKKALGYAVQEVKGDALTESRTPNMLNSLSGQIAGLQISNASTGGLGGSPKVIIRGEVSLTNNNPLFVVDGVPISNNSSNNKGDGPDFGNGAGDVNPDDVASISVLKGPTAAALYGSRAANGAIIITTKSGKKGNGLGVTVNSNIVVQPWLLRMPDYQNKYGTGENFEYKYVDGKYAGTNDGSGYVWGPRLDQKDPSTKSGYVEIAQFDSPIDPTTGARIPTPWVSHPNARSNFFNTGTIFTNNVSISNSNEQANYRLSFTSMKQKGIMPNTDLTRNTISLNSGYKLSEKVSVNANFNYVQNQSANMPQINYGSNSLMYNFLYLGSDINMNSLKDYWAPGKQSLQQRNSNNLWYNNPYFVLYENTNSQLKNRIYGNVSLNIKIIEGLKLVLRSGTDWYSDNMQERQAFSSIYGYEVQPTGNYKLDNNIFQEINSSFLLTWNKPIKGDWQYNASLGGNRMDRSTHWNEGNIIALAVPNIYSLSNSKVPPQADEYNTKKIVNSVYATGELVYKNRLFLDVTARNDWASSLSAANNSFFYPSISASALLSEMLTMPSWISFAKIRASLAQVGNDTEPYKLKQVYTANTRWGNTPSYTEGGTLYNPNISPEKINSAEVGLNIHFLQNRIGLDLAYYNTIATNQILNMTIASSSGYNELVTNAGKIESRGAEVVLNGKPIVNKDFEWNVILNWSINRSYVRELVAGLESYGTAWPSEARVGGRMGDLYLKAYKHTPDGKMIYENGLPQWANDKQPIKCGNSNPDWMAGLKNTFTYKRLKLSALLDYRKGGQIYSETFSKGMWGGSLAESAVGDIREVPYVGNGVIESKDASGKVSYTPNNVAVNYRDWVDRMYSDPSEASVFDASFIKLREITFTYTLPLVKVGSVCNLHNVAFSVTGQNLWMWAKAPHIDPETSLGYEQIQLPTPKNLGFSVSVSF